LWRILWRPSLELGELYTEGAWEADGNDLMDALHVLMGLRLRAIPWPSPLCWLHAILHENNRLNRGRRQARLHYNNDVTLFSTFLDEDLHYSCAYFRKPGFSLHEAQQAKAVHIASKLRLPSQAHVLDIGSGWGAMAIHLARHHGAQVTGLNVSEEQNHIAAERAQHLNLGQQVHFLTEDYRQHQGCYDAIVSIGMFEHVGRPWYKRYFRTISRLLKPDGVALVHTIGRSSQPGGTNPWIRRHIFPGGYVPALSEVSAAVQASGLAILDVEVWRLHYAMTIQHWRTSFEKDWNDLAARFGETFCRMWRFYLAASEASFRWDDLVVFQVQLGFAETTRCPITREYLYADNPA
jgi:cyclopropane-fatty-acyl-phospholipid synthase